MEQETIICSAIKRGRKIWYGHRHMHCYDAMHGELSWEMSRKQIVQEEGRVKEGFVTSKGRFVARKEAQVIHKATVGKSADKNGYRGDELYSEDLY